MTELETLLASFRKRNNEEREKFNQASSALVVAVSTYDREAINGILSRATDDTTATDNDAGDTSAGDISGSSATSTEVSG